MLLGIHLYFNGTSWKHKYLRKATDSMWFTQSCNISCINIPNTKLWMNIIQLINLFLIIINYNKTYLTCCTLWLELYVSGAFNDPIFCKSFKTFFLYLFSSPRFRHLVNHLWTKIYFVFPCSQQWFENFPADW